MDIVDNDIFTSLIIIIIIIHNNQRVHPENQKNQLYRYVTIVGQGTYDGGRGKNNQNGDATLRDLEDVKDGLK